MKIVINGEDAETECDTLQALILQLGHGEGSVATAINREFVPICNRTKTVLAEGDLVEIVAPMSGG